MARPIEAKGSGSSEDRAFVSRMRSAFDASWPEAMTRELQACETPGAWRAWSEKWAAYLSGEMQREGGTRDRVHPSPG